MRILPCALVHHTGSMIRFRTRQLDDLPDRDIDLQIVLPTGRIINGHFRRNPANPNISGPDLVQYIKRIIDFGEPEDALLEQVGPYTWRLYRIRDALEVVGAAKVAKKRVKTGALEQNDIARILALADKHSNRKERVQTYGRILRPSSLRRLMLNVAGTSCQVEGCSAAEDFTRDFKDEAAGRVIVEVHHIEAVARCNDHHPRNLCVLCANHHRLIHGWGRWETEHIGPDVRLSYEAHKLLIVRTGPVFTEAA